MLINTNGKLFLCFLLLLCFVNNSFDRQQQNDPEYKRAYRKAESVYNLQHASDTDDSLALALYLKAIRLHNASPDYMLWNSCYKAGILYQTDGAFADAIPLFRKALSISAEAGIPDSLLYLPNVYLGNSYYSISLLDSAVYHYRIAEQFVLKYPRLEGRERLYNTLGAVNYESGDYLQSARYFEKALQVLTSEQPGNTTLLVNYKNNIAASYRQLKQFDKALRMFRDLLQYGLNTDELMHNIASVYLELDQPREAISWLEKVKSPGQLKYNDLALSYFKLKVYDSARLYLNSALVLNTSNKGRKNVYHAQSLRYLGNLLLIDKKIDSALLKYQESIVQLVPGYNEADPRNNPASFDGQYFVLELFESLLEKAKAFRKRFATSSDKADLIACNETYRSLYILVDQVSRNYESEEARYFLQDKKHLTHNEPIEVALQLYTLTKDEQYLNQAFEFDERNKAVILSLQVQQHQARVKAELPAGLLQKERTIRKEIQQIHLANSHDTLLAADRLRDLQLQLAQTQKQFDDLPAYKRARNLNNIVTVNQLQHRIPVNGAILSYHVGDTSLITFFITKHSFAYARTTIDPRFLASIHPLLIAIQNRFGYDRSALDNSFRDLYDRLLLPFEKQVAEFEQLMIIPDDELVWIPFQLLKNAGGELLIENHSIVYNYSCSILNETSARPVKRDNKILAMAPFTEKGPMSLPGTTEEIMSIKGTKVTSSAATRQFFMDSAGKYDIIHLATHAYVDDSLPDKSFVRFYSGNLYASEIMDVPLQNTHLVILSACETGSGQLIRGEGLMSITRAFSFAGCPETIASLWKADDYSTARIASGLHKYMADGVGPVGSLQKATLDYLNNDKVVVSQKTPAYWAHLRLIGTFDNTESSSSVIIIVSVIGFLGILLTIYFLRRRSSV